MADNNQLLLENFGELLKAEREQTRKIVREEVNVETEPMKKDIAILKYGQVQTNKDIAILKDGQTQNTTMVEAVLAGQEELQKTGAREATVLTGFAKLTGKVNDHEERITELEKVSIP
jgi:hypothetical protein